MVKKMFLMFVLAGSVVLGAPRHNLIHMLAMRQADILVKHQTVDDSQHTIHTVNG